MLTERPTLERIRQSPKVLLHDHLDGGLRPATVADLAKAIGYNGLPSHEPDVLAEWFTEGARGLDLEKYLSMFVHTVSVLQTREALTRAAAECVEDLAADGIVYAEIRFAPELHTEKGLSLDEVVDAVLEGVRTGTGRLPIVVASSARPCARRAFAADRGTRVRHRDEGVVGSTSPAPKRAIRRRGTSTRVS